MATFEQYKLALQTHQNLEGLRRDMRQNALAYKAQLLAGKTVAKVSSIMREDAMEYLRRLAWQKAIADSPARLANLSSGLLAFGSSTVEAQDCYSELNTVAINLSTVTLNNASQINAAADSILTNVTNHDSVW